MFDTNGQLFFPADSGGGVLWAPQPRASLLGARVRRRHHLVNGKSWPFLDVDQKRYPFLLINGSNARAYELSLVTRCPASPARRSGSIGTDGGYLDVPVKIDPAAAANRSW